MREPSWLAQWRELELKGLCWRAGGAARCRSCNATQNRVSSVRQVATRKSMCFLPPILSRNTTPHPPKTQPHRLLFNGCIQRNTSRTAGNHMPGFAVEFAACRQLVSGVFAAERHCGGVVRSPAGRPAPPFEVPASSHSPADACGYSSTGWTG